MITELEARRPNLEVLGVQAGLHVTIVLPSDHRDRDVAAQLEADGLIVEPLSNFPQLAGSEINGLTVDFALINRSTAKRFADSVAGALS